MIAIIDADSIAYICSKDNIEESIRNVDSLIYEILTAVNADKFILVLSKDPYFRHKVNPRYKANRPETSLLFTKTIKAYLQEEFDTFSVPGVEADDLISYLVEQNNFEDNITVCSIDKDVLYTIPGTNYNYSKKEFVTISKNAAIKYIFKQVLMGDSSDNITGVPGIGEVKASKILEEVTNIADLPNVVMNVFVSHYKSLSAGIYYFQQNFRQVYLLRTDEEFKRELGEDFVLSNAPLNLSLAHFSL